MNQSNSNEYRSQQQNHRKLVLKNLEKMIISDQIELEKDRREQQITYTILAFASLSLGYCICNDFKLVTPTTITLKGLSAIAVGTRYVLKVKKIEAQKKSTIEQTSSHKFRFTYINTSFFLESLCVAGAIYNGASILSSGLVLWASNFLCNTIVEIKKQYRTIKRSNEKIKNCIELRERLLCSELEQDSEESLNIEPVCQKKK